MDPRSALFVLILVFWLVVFVVWTRRTTTRVSFVRIFIGLSLFIYTAAVSYQFGRGAYLEHQLAQYDLDGNGSFSPEESTPAQQQAMDLVASDTARTLAPFVWLVLAPIFSGVAVGASALAWKLRRGADPSR